MRRFWLAIILLSVVFGVVGIGLMLVSEAAYPHEVRIIGVWMTLVCFGTLVIGVLGLVGILMTPRVRSVLPTEVPGRTVIRSLWLVIVVVGLIGIVLYAVATYDYYRFVGSERYDLRGLDGLREWSRFYNEYNFPLLVAPLLIIVIGVAGFRRTRRYRWQFRLGIPTVVRRNSIASIAIMLSIINFGILMWQILPEGSYTPPDTPFRYSTPSGDFRDVTDQRIRGLERQLSDIQGGGLFNRSIVEMDRAIDSLSDCVNSLKSGREYGRFTPGC